MRLILTACAALTIAACGGDEPAAETQAQSAKARPTAPTSPGKLTAPISIDYDIMGNPVVGQPVGINLKVTSPMNDRAITVHYRVNEVGSMRFPESQAEKVELLPMADAETRSQQVTVIPEREGRIFVVVSAVIETDVGPMMKSMSIPIQVGRGQAEAQVEDTLVEGTDGELGVSLPATEPR